MDHVTITGEMLIGHEAVGGEEFLYAVDPATGATLQPGFVTALQVDVDLAAQLAGTAFEGYRQASYAIRAGFLEAIADNILALGDQLIERAASETGLPKVRIEGERGRTVGQLRLFAQLVRDEEWFDVRVDSAPASPSQAVHPDLRLRQIPIGPVAVFGASNFPLAFSVAGGDTASALAAGCPVVVKGHPAHPGTSELVGRSIQAAVRACGLPEGVFSLLPGGVETGAALARHSAIKAIGFTGSRSGGLALVALAAGRPEPIPVYAEMSSVNPVFLLPGALNERAEALAEGFVSSLTLGEGQFCTNPGLVFALGGPDLDRFLSAASKRLAQHRASAMLTPSIHRAYTTGVNLLENHPDVGGAGESGVATSANTSPACLFETTGRAFIANERLGQEIFGASSLVVRCADQDEMMNMALGLEGQLTATIHLAQDDMNAACRLLPILETKAGRLIANGWPTGVAVSPAMVHGGPYPATSDSRTTSVGTMAVRRFLRPVCYQDIPEALLPPELRRP